MQRGALAGFVLGASLVGLVWWASSQTADRDDALRPRTTAPPPLAGTRGAAPTTDGPRAHPVRARRPGEEPPPGEVPPEIASEDAPSPFPRRAPEESFPALAPGDARSAAELARAVQSAQVWKDTPGNVATRLRIESLLADRDGSLAETGIGLAAEEGATDLLLRAAQDEGLGSLRGAALLAAVRAAPKDPDVVRLVEQASRGNDGVLRPAAERLIGYVGDDPVETVLRRLRDGPMDDESLVRAGERIVELGHPGTVLADPGLPPLVIPTVLRTMPVAWIEIPELIPRVADLTDRHPDPGVRETARRRLQETHPYDARGVEIVSAIYGIDTRTMDVTEEIRGRLTRGRAVFMVWSDLGGDPAVGITKTLRVEIVFRGRRLVRTARDAEWITIP